MRAGLVAVARRLSLTLLAVRVHRPTMLWIHTRAALLLDRLVHRVDDAEVVFGMLKIAFRHHPVAAAGRIAAELEVFLEQLLRGAAHPDIRPAAIEHMVAVQRDVAAALMTDRSGAASARVAAGTAPMLASTHAFHVVHLSSVALSC